MSSPRGQDTTLECRWQSPDGDGTAGLLREVGGGRPDEQQS
jgi:hypothetical protein